MASGFVRFSATWRHLLLLLLLLLLVHLQLLACARKPPCPNAKFSPKEELMGSRGSMWDWVSFMPLLNGSEFTNVAEPLLLMCTNAYKFQYHVNPSKQDHLLPIKGWSLSLKVPPAAPLRKGAGGVHALVYEEDPIPFSGIPPRVVLTFRGWQTSSSSLDTLADLCAGQLLFPHYVDFLSPPSHLCSALFNESTLDYLSQAIAYAHLVLRSYPPSLVLLTGHGFGGGLAVLVSAALQQQCCSSNKLVGGLTSVFGGLYNSHQHSKTLSCSGVRLPVISFSGPGTLQDIHDWGWTIHGRHHIITISHQWDFFSVCAQWKDHLGWLCLYEKQEPASCEACFSDEQRFSSPKVLKPRASMDGVFEDKEKNDDHDDDDDSDKDKDDDDRDEDDKDEHGDKDKDDKDKDDDDDDDDDNDDQDEHHDKDKDDDDHDHDDKDKDDDDCPYDDEPCWDCLSDTNAPESLLAVMEERSRPSCVFLGGPHVSAKPGRSHRRHKHA